MILLRIRRIEPLDAKEHIAGRNFIAHETCQG